MFKTSTPSDENTPGTPWPLHDCVVMGDGCWGGAARRRRRAPASSCTLALQVTRNCMHGRCKVGGVEPKRDTPQMQTARRPDGPRSTRTFRCLHAALRFTAFYARPRPSNFMYDVRGQCHRCWLTSLAGLIGHDAVPAATAISTVCIIASLTSHYSHIIT